MSQRCNSLTQRGFGMMTRPPRGASCCYICVYWLMNGNLRLLLTTHASSLLLSSAPSIFDNKRQDPTGLTALLQSTDLVGVVHTLYCILLHSFVPESASQSQEPYGPGVIQVALQGIRFLNSFALLDLSAFQVFIVNPEYFLHSHVINSNSFQHPEYVASLRFGM